MREIGRTLHRDRGERAHPHQHLAVAGDDEDAPLRPRQREAKPDHRRTPHRAPEIEIARIVAGGRHVPGGRAEPAHDQEIAALGEEGFDGGAPVEHGATSALRR